VSGIGDSDEIAIANYNPQLQAVLFKGGFFAVVGAIFGTFLSFLLGIFHPGVANKAGPDWLWMGGRDDIIRNLYFRPNGSFRRYGRLALAATLIAGSAACYWMQRPL
jgi:hypothetical protein